MHFILVTFGFDDIKQVKWRNFLRAFPAATYDVIENNYEYKHTDKHVHSGSNAQFEFSGYLEGMECARVSTSMLIILNDTLFSHHFTLGWQRLLQRTLGWKPGIYGDPRIEPISWDGRPLRIYASWMFVLSGFHAQIVFKSELEKVIQSFQKPLQFQDYEAYMNRYLRGSWVSGYTKPALMQDSREKKRKMQCIHAEHRLGRALDILYGIRNPPSVWYPIVHLADRALSFWRRMH